ncbi:MAG: sensor histidine kinase [Sulfurovaceae bacterium]
MQVSKNKATNSLLASEKKSLFRFLTLYVLMMMSIIVLISLFYYQNQEKMMFLSKRDMLSDYAYEQIKKLKVLHNTFPAQNTYPRDPRFKSAIYDLEYVKIFSLLESDDIDFNTDMYITYDNKIHFVKTLFEYYVGAKYLFLEIPDDGEWRKEAWKNIFIFGGLAIVFFTIVGFYIANLFLNPMRSSLLLLDRFIKDTTHELNTPLSTILANIEMMDKSSIGEDNKKKINRINIAAKTVSQLYQDLTYLTLEHDMHKNDENVETKALIENRVEYFDILAKTKDITFVLDLKKSYIHINRHKWTRVIDNLLSNAIKYNNRKGIIHITLRQNMLTISDTGIGIEMTKIPFVFDRYIRFNQSEGGFGIGLSIIKKIIEEYNMKIEIKSKPNEGTVVIVKW